MGVKQFQRTLRVLYIELSFLCEWGLDAFTADFLLIFFLF